MDAASTDQHLIYHLGRQRQFRGRYDETRWSMTRATAVEKFWVCVGMSRKEFNRTTRAMRLTDADGKVVVGDDGRRCEVDLAEERRVQREKTLAMGGGVEGLLQRELKKNMSVGRDGVIGGRLDVVG